MPAFMANTLSSGSISRSSGGGACKETVFSSLFVSLGMMEGSEDASISSEPGDWSC